MTDASVSENSITSNASSPQPIDAATSARRAGGFATRHHPKSPASSAGVAAAMVARRLPADRVWNVRPGDRETILPHRDRHHHVVHEPANARHVVIVGV